jgi:indolepyruvate ferredoxin oxidoreductase
LILSGVDTLVRLLVLRQQLDQRDGLTTATMVSGYPGSPLGGFDLTLDALGADVLKAHRILHRPGLNEELAAAIVWGSQMGAVIPYDGVDGVAGAWYGKGPGLDRYGALVGGGVGCHGIMYFEARHAGMKALPPPPMGAEGVPWIGLSPFVAEPHVIQNLGDGTFSHSGTLAIRASVAAGADITFKILYNATVAMTGGQDVTGLMDVPAMTRALEAEGAAKIVVCAEEPESYGRRARWAAGTEVHGRDRLAAAQEELRSVPGVTVIIYDQRCAAQSRRLRKRGQLAEPPRRVIINEAVCEGCGDCGVKSNCLSVLPVATEFGEKRRIHDPSCNRDYTCLEGDCPSFVTIKPRKRGRRRARAGGARPALPAGSLPVPARPAAGLRYGIYFTGIGGTGVVTANRIIATAAEAVGFAIGGLDQTGCPRRRAPSSRTCIWRGQGPTSGSRPSARKTRRPGG